MDEASRDISSLTPDEIEDRICTLASHLYAGTARFLSLVAEYELRGDWEANGFASCSAWLSWRCGVKSRTAREQVRVARGLRDLPLVSAAFSRGELSYSKVRAICRLRMARTDREADLLMLARHATAAQLERMVSVHVQITPVPYLEPGNLSTFSHNLNDDGTMSIHVRLPAEDGAVILKALEKASEELWQAEQEARAEREELGEGGSAEPPAAVAEDVLNGSAEPPELTVGGRPPRPKRAECLAAMASSYLTYGYKHLATAEKYQVVLETSPTCIRGIGPASKDSVRRIACDSTLIDMSQNSSIGRRSRQVPAHMKRLLEKRDPCCRFPGCENTLGLDAHHVHHWADGGETSTANLVRLCGRHHRLVHEGGWSISGSAEQGYTFTSPLRRRMEQSPQLVPRPPDPFALEKTHRALGINPDAETSRDLSRGERMNLDYAVTALVEFCG